MLCSISNWRPVEYGIFQFVLKFVFRQRDGYFFSPIIKFMKNIYFLASVFSNKVQFNIE